MLKDRTLAADKSGSSPGDNFYNRDWETGPSAVALEILLGLEWEVKLGSGYLSRLS